MDDRAIREETLRATFRALERRVGEAATVCARAVETESRRWEAREARARARGERDGGEVARDVDEVESTDVEVRRGAGKTREARRGETRGETMATSGGGEKGRAGDARKCETREASGVRGVARDG